MKIQFDLNNANDVAVSQQLVNALDETTRELTIMCKIIDEDFSKMTPAMIMTRALHHYKRHIAEMVNEYERCNS